MGDALRKLGALATVEAFSASVNGRLSLKAGEDPEESRLKPPGTPGAEKTYVTRVLQRDRLQSCLLREAAKYPQIGVEFGVACEGVYLEGDQPAVRFCAPAADEEGCELDGLIEDDRVQSYDLVVGADGVRSAVRESLSLYVKTRTVRFEDKNERRYKTLPLHPSAVAGTASDSTGAAATRASTWDGCAADDGGRDGRCAPRQARHAGVQDHGGAVERRGGARLLRGVAPRDHPIRSR